MGTVLNIRGTNGAGKTTLARAFLPPNLNGDAAGGPVDLNSYPAPTKKDPGRMLRVEGYGWSGGPGGSVGLIGSYRTACGGLDTVPDFATQRGAIRHMLDKVGTAFVIAEGVLASTVYGSWATFDTDITAEGHRFAWVYLHTPLEVCYERIAQRQADAGRPGKEIKRELVADKYRAIQQTRNRALADGRLVFDLPYGAEAATLTAIMEAQRARA